MQVKAISSSSKPFTANLMNATGVIDYPLTNDYMFRAILQKNIRVLKALICALLHFDINDVKSIEITNPIELGESTDTKDFILDIIVSFNNNTIINLEMQVENQFDWQERSLSYLCRSFDQLRSGQNYDTAKPVIHIGFLDFTPFKEHPEFYATYKLLNVKNHHLYSDKFILSVVSLNQIDLATEEDKTHRIDYWARLFKARTWEELKMVAEKDEYLQEASEALYTLNADEITRQKCQARADYYRRENMMKKRMEELENKTEALTSENKSLTSKNKSLTSENEVLKKLLTEHGITIPTEPTAK